MKGFLLFKRTENERVHILKQSEQGGKETEGLKWSFFLWLKLGRAYVVFNGFIQVYASP